MLLVPPMLLVACAAGYLTPLFFGEKRRRRENGKEKGEGEKDSTRGRGTSRTVCSGWACKGEDLDTKQREITEKRERSNARGQYAQADSRPYGEKITLVKA